MGEIVFLGIEEILDIHLDQIERYGGSPETRDVDALRSALAVPQATFDNRYLHEDIYAMASAYLYHITQNHPFVDGNKRTGAVASLIFLALNGIELDATESDFEHLVWEVAKGKADKRAIANFFREHSEHARIVGADMKLVELELKNFRQHLDTVVTFTDGVTGIIGPNGSGKTTILEAISWALYGAPAVRGTNDTIRSKASEGGAKVSVNLTFELGGSIYRAVRTLDGSGRSGSAVLEVDGRPLRSGMSEVSEAITKLLGMDYRAFFTSFFTNQKAIEFMAALDGRARANAISKMLGYDRVTRAREQANEDRKALHNQIEGLERGLPDPEELKERRKTAQAQLAGAKNSLETAEESQKAAQEVLDRLRPLKDAFGPESQAV